MPDKKPRNVVEALATVMSEVTMIGKTGWNDHQKFPFRGIDGTVNVIGPIMRKYGLLMIPKVESYDYASIEAGKARTVQQHARVTVGYTFHFSNDAGEMSELYASVPGESMDSGDKATAKAMSVAWRTALLQTFVVPTMEPDPDEYTVPQEAPASVASVPVTLDRVLMGLDANWDNPDMLRNIYSAANAAGLLGTEIVDKATGENVVLGAHIEARGLELSA